MLKEQSFNTSTSLCQRCKICNTRNAKTRPFSRSAASPIVWAANPIVWAANPIVWAANPIVYKQSTAVYMKVKDSWKPEEDTVLRHPAKYKQSEGTQDTRPSTNKVLVSTWK
jgi:hypothetical protein